MISPEVAPAKGLRYYEDAEKIGLRQSRSNGAGERRVAIACSTSAWQGSLAEALAQISEMGFEHVDLIAIASWGHIRPADLVSEFELVADEIERLLAKHKLAPVALNAAVTHLHERADKAVNEQRLRECEAIAKLMNRLDVKVASFGPGRRVSERPWEQTLDDEAATFGEMLEIARAAGVTFAVELHYNTAFETLAQAHKLLTAVPELKVAYDPSHFVMQEIDIRDTAELLDRAAHVHLRDAGPGQMQVPVGEGNVDFGWIINGLSERRYQGHYSIEYLPGIEGGPRAQIEKLRDLLLGKTRD